MAISALDLRPRVPLLSTQDVAVRVGPRLRLVHVLRVSLVLMVVANLGYIPLASYGRKEAPFLFNDLLILLLVGIGTLLAVRNRRLVLDLPASFALAFAAVGAISAILAVPKFELTAFQLAFSLAYLARWLAYFAVYLLVINFVRRPDVSTVWSALEAGILLFSVFGIVQAIFLPGFAQMVYPESEVYVDWDYQGHRLVSSFLDPNFAGGLIVVGLLVLLARLSYGVPVAYWKLVVVTTALVLTVSRSAILAFLAGLLVILAGRGLSRRLLKVGAALLLLAIPFLPLIVGFAASFDKFSFGASAMARVVSWVRAFEIFADNPVLGVGFNTYGFAQEAYGYQAGGRATFTVEGGLLFVAVMTGVVGIAVYCGMLALVLRRCRRIWTRAAALAEDRGLALGTAAVTVALVVHSVFVNSLLYPFLMEPLWVLWALTFVISRPESGPESVEAPAPVAAGPRLAYPGAA